MRPNTPPITWYVFAAAAAVVAVLIVSLDGPYWASATLAAVSVAGVLVSVVATGPRPGVTPDRRARIEALVAEAGRDPDAFGAVSRPIEDVLELARSELAARRPVPWAQSAEIRAVIGSLEAPTLIADAEGLVVFANGQAVSMLSPSREIVGRTIEELFTKAEILDLIASARRGLGRSARVQSPSPETSVILDVAAVPFPIGSNSGQAGVGPAPVLVTLRDVTELAGAAQLKTDFVANASHELRTPIAAIRAALDTLELAGADETMRARLVTMIASHAQRLDEMVRDLLDLSKLESPDAPLRIRPVSGSTIAAEIEGLLGDRARSREVGLVFSFPPEFEHMRTDPTVLRLILKNLTENAIKFARPGTDVRIEGAILPSGAATPEGDDTGTGERSLGARFRVIDRGDGITIDQQQRIFERFYQVEASRSGKERGTGLGLAIVKHGVRALGGSVSVESVWRKGTTMTVELPGCVTLPPPAAQTPPDPSSEPVSGSG